MITLFEKTLLGTKSRVKFIWHSYKYIKGLAQKGASVNRSYVGQAQLVGK